MICWISIFVCYEVLQMNNEVEKNFPVLLMKLGTTSY